MKSPRTRLLAAAALAILVAGVPLDAVAKKKKKSRVRAAVNGKVVKFNRNVSITAGGTIAFFLIAQTRPKGTLRTIGVACAAWPPATVPGDGAYCSANYQEMKISRQPTLRGWLNHPGQMQVTFESYDGDVISGRVSGDLAGITGDPPVRIEGEFRGRVTVAQ
jgi:hypothetical protein